MLVGNGYVPAHADLTLALRSEPALRKLFETRYV
jgi:L-erythro-3,5-diaminohexanoate dehydrogenase